MTHRERGDGLPASPLSSHLCTCQSTHSTQLNFISGKQRTIAKELKNQRHLSDCIGGIWLEEGHKTTSK